jgi:CRISPR-associated Csx2 family protein
MSTTLITVLGKGRDDPKTGYREATYQFSNEDPHKTAFFGLALAEHLKPDSIIMLGTAGSMWGVLVEKHAIDGEDEELRLELIEAETEARVTQEMLNRVAPLLTRILKRSITLRLIPSGKDASEQIEILDVIASAIGKNQNDLHFDLTHGYRHLGMIGFLSSFMLERLRKQVNVHGLWYGALDMTQNGITPVLRLDGLNAVQKWVSALDKFDANGDYGIFAPLLEADGFPKDKAQNLKKAAFATRTTNVADAARHLQAVLSLLDEPDMLLRGASALFRENLKKNLRWARANTLDEQQRLLALQALERGDFLRTTILGLEALISRLCLENKADPLDYKVREEFDKKFQIEIKQDKQRDWKSDAYWKLKNLRNAMAHGIPPSYQALQKLMKNEEHLAKELQGILSRLSNEH